MLVRGVLTHAVAGGCCPLQCVHNIYCPCLCAGGQRRRKHRQLSLLSASLHDPLAQRGRVQCHHRRPQKVGENRALRARKTHLMHLLGSSLHNYPFFCILCRKPADLHNLAPGTHPPFLTFDGEVKTDINKIEEFLEETLCPPK